MPKSVKAAVEKMKPLYAAQPWQCRHHKDHSEILAYVEASGAWETIARIERTAGASAEAAATFIARSISDAQQNRSALLGAMDALELCLIEARHTFSPEQAAERSVTNIKKIIAG